jgi:hypothetical protein
MLRISHYLALAAGAAALLAQPALAQAHSVRSHHAGYRHHHYNAPAAYGYRDVGATLNEIVTSPFSGPFGGYEDAHAAWQSSGPKERHYFGAPWWEQGFGYRSDRRFGYGPDRRSELDGMVEQQASANGVPASLVHRVIMRESRYNPRAVSSGNYARRWAAS